ncbi:hypothetical protein [Kordia zhangzhouensis]|uniref:hypothetical protein n=1 Tax=Kordia zhangzhouensis TaxID=1620405 RepID=UPI0006290C84|nr:hypothetical protein [Kordia zhangzhouensis]
MIKSLRLFLIITSLFIITIPISCNNDDDSNSDCGNVVCTLEFRTIVISIKDQNQNPVALDSFEVINIENNDDMTILLSTSEFEMAQQFGQYPLLNDTSLEVNQEREIQFKGFINNQEVISSIYTVSTDCCHISLVSGTLELTL